MTDYEAAQAMQIGGLPSPTKYGDFWLFDLRITGTGVAFRDALDEWAVRDPAVWLDPAFVERCAGLPVIFEHPKASGLNSDEFRERSIGVIVLPYVKGDEVWGVAKIFDADAAELMQTTHTSTSPGVTPPKGSQATETNSGAKVLVEGLPLVLDHLAVCEVGVWDKDGPPRGIRLDTRKDGSVAKSVEELESELNDAKARADAAEAEREDAKRRADAAEAERDDLKAKRDAKKKDEDEKAAMAAAEKEKLDAAKRDSRKDRHSKHDGDIVDCAKCDSEEEKEREDAAKKDAMAAKTPVDAERGTDIIKDSVTALQREIAELKAAQRPLSMEERDEIAKAFMRADRAYQMLGDQTPQAVPGESPIAYRRRLANGLRKYTKSWQTYAFHDAQQVRDFGLVEDEIFKEAEAYAKNPPSDATVGRVREITTTVHGKTRTEFIGDAKTPWIPFMHPTKFALKSIKRPAGSVYR